MSWRFSHTPRTRPLIAHVVYRFDVGGMENGLVNLINRLPDGFANHCVIALTYADAAFSTRLSNSSVRVISMGKRPGPMLMALPRLYSLFRTLHPEVVHTRNVGTLEAQIAAFAARVPVRIHGEHGWDIGDLSGENTGLLRLRRVLRPFVQHQIALSSFTHDYLARRVGVAESRITNICNGVDTHAFAPVEDARPLRASVAIKDSSARDVMRPDAFIVGAIGRLADVKNIPLLIDAFAAVRERSASFREVARLAIVGDGPSRAGITARIESRGLRSATWLAGARGDIANCLCTLDLLCLPSLAEGISNTILESMACGIPVVATDVGGNRELVADGVTGSLVPSGSVRALADAIETFFVDPGRRRRAAHAGRQRAVTQFSLDAMIAKYHRVYCTQLARAGWPQPSPSDVARPISNA